MIRNNWSILIIAALLIGLVILTNVSQVIVRERSLTKSELLSETKRLDLSSVAPSTTFEEDKALSIPSGEHAYHYLPLNNALLYTTTTNLLQDRYSYTYHLYEYYLKSDMITAIESSVPFRMNLLNGDSNFVIYTMEHPDNSAKLMSYHRASNTHTLIREWDEISNMHRINYYGGQLILYDEHSFEVYSGQGQRIDVNYTLDEGSLLGAAGIQNNTIIMFYEKDDLRYLDTFNLVNNNTTHMLVNLRVSDFKASANEVIAVLETPDQTILDIYTLPSMSHRRLEVTTIASDITLYQNRQVALRDTRDRRVTVVDLRTLEILNRQSYPDNLDHWAFQQSQQLLFYRPSVSTYEIVTFSQ